MSILIKLNMKKLILIVILTFGIQTYTNADDVRDFQIEGFSIGDSLLNFFNKKKIEDEKFFEKEQGNNKKVARFYIREKRGNYDWIALSYKTSDKKYEIIELSGFIFMPFNKCLKKRDEIDNEIKNMFSESEKQISGTTKHFLDKNSFVNHVAYWTSQTLNDYVSLTCYDWSNESGYRDQLRVEAYSHEYYEWLLSLQNN